MFSLLNDRFFDESSQRMNRIFEALHQAHDGWGTLRDEKEQYVLVVPLPGLTEKDVEINATERSIHLKTGRRNLQNEGWTMIWSERQPLGLSQALALPTRIDPDKVQASLKNGLLTVTLPKQGVVPRSIPVQV